MPLALAGVAYFRGLRRVWRRAGFGRGVRPAAALAFGAGLVVLAVMLALPLHAWGRLRFTPHMIAHELLTLVAAPLPAAGGAGVPWLFALPPSWRRRVGRWLAGDRLRRFWRSVSRPAAAWALHGAALWLWHAPALFEAALRSELIHDLQHVSLLATAPGGAPILPAYMRPRDVKGFRSKEGARLECRGSARKLISGRERRPAPRSPSCTGVRGREAPRGWDPS